MSTSKIRGIYERIKANELLSKGISDTNFYFLANAGTKVINFLIIPLITRLVGVEQFAVYDLFLLWSGILTMIAGLGMDSGAAIIIAENKGNYEKLKTILSQSLLSNIVVLLVLWLAAHVYLQFFTVPYLDTNMVHAVFIYSLFSLVSYLIFSFIRWLGDSKRAALGFLVSSVAGTILGFVLLYLSPTQDIKQFLLGLIIGNALGALVCVALAYRFLSLRSVGDASVFRELLKLSLPFVPTYAGSYFMQVIDRYIVTYFFGLQGLGLYALTYRVAQIPNVMLQILNKGFQPVIYSNYQEERGKKLGRQLFDGYVLSLVPVCLVTILLAPFLVQFFGGETFGGAVPILPAVVMTVMVYGALYLDGYGFTIARKTQYIAYITLASLVATGAMAILAAQYIGLFGVAISTLVVSMVTVYVYCRWSERLYAFGYRLHRMAWIFVLVLLLTVLDYFI